MSASGTSEIFRFCLWVSCHYFPVMVQYGRISWLLSAFEHTINILLYILSYLILSDVVNCNTRRWTAAAGRAAWTTSWFSEALTPSITASATSGNLLDRIKFRLHIAALSFNRPNYCGSRSIFKFWVDYCNWLLCHLDDCESSVLFILTFGLAYMFIPSDNISRAMEH